MEFHKGVFRKTIKLAPWVVGVVGLIVITEILAFGQINMPDPSMIAGQAIPAPELPDGTVSVRVVRQELGDNLVDQEVTITVAGTSQTAMTGDDGRAQITGLSSGASGTAEAVVNGETLISSPFQIPQSGGIRVILIAELAERAERLAREAAEASAAPPVKGVVTFGGDSRVVVEFRDDTLEIFYVLEIVNSARAPVDIGGPLIVELPTGAAGAAVLPGSTSAAIAQGDRVTVPGPFGPGSTQLQIGYRLLHDSDTLTLTQRWPVALDQVLVIVQKVGNMTIDSAHFTEADETQAANGTLFMLGGNPKGIPAGGELSVLLSGLPVASSLPRYTALALAGLILIIGSWAAAGGSRSEDAERRLVSRRDSLYGELVKLEEQRQATRIDGSRYAAKRKRFLSDLERVYGELDGITSSQKKGSEVGA
tara:strand:+ start:563 stop:1831 length:1269 start_codon:yes stop_codon:yes gene_type:complete